MNVAGTGPRGLTQAQIAELEARVVASKDAGMSFREIAKEEGFSLGYMHKVFRNALRHIVEPSVAEYRRNQLDRLAHLRATVDDILATEHVTVSQGRVVAPIIGREPDLDEAGNPNPHAGDWIYGEPLIDDGPILAAAKTLLDIDKREADLLGLFPNTKVDVDLSGGIQVEWVGVNPEEVV